MFIKYKNIFCIWVWVLSFFYLKNFLSFSPLYLAFGCALFSLNPYYIFYRRNSIKQLTIGLIEYVLFIIIFHKNIIVDKKPLINITNILISITIFLLYLLIDS